MKLVSASEMRGLDERTMASGIPGEELMLTAGEGLADAIRNLASSHQLEDSPVLFLAGCGNNGGDAFVAARILYEDGWPVECWLAAAAQAQVRPAPAAPILRRRDRSVDGAAAATGLSGQKSQTMSSPT